MYIKLAQILFLNESKQSIINLGFPEIIASILYEQYGNNAFTISKWYKDYNSLVPTNRWWKQTNESFSDNRFLTYIDFYNAAKISLDEYNKIRNQNEFGSVEASSFDKQQTLSILKKEIKGSFFNNIFFNRNLIKDFTTGKITDLAPYKDFSFIEANEKYESKTMFSDSIPIKQYPNGWKWIDVGKKCDLVGKQMKNCGSTGVMSLDIDKTMLVLFDNSNIPHAVATYSPNENRLSGVEGQASTQIKNEYIDYVIDLIKTLNVDFDYEKSQSKFLKIKYLLFSNYKQMKSISIDSKYNYNEFFYIKTKNNEEWFSNGYEFVAKQEVVKINFKMFKPTPKNLFDKLKIIFDRYEKDKILAQNSNIKYLSINDLMAT